MDTSRNNSINKKRHLWIVLIPILAAVFPATVIYAENSRLLNISSWTRVASIQAGIGVGIFIAFSLVTRKFDYRNALASLVIILFYNFYGGLFTFLLKQDFIQVTHASLTPLYLFVIYFVSKQVLSVEITLARTLSIYLLIILSVLLTYNLVIIGRSELEKEKTPSTQSVNLPDDIEGDLTQQPDIYFILFDEFSGFPPMREYWHNANVDLFKQFLIGRGFTVAEQSVSSSIDTLHQMAIRLNYQDYPLGKEYLERYYSEISDNRAMKFLKNKGYRTIVFDESNATFAYPSKPPVLADVTFDDVKTNTSGSVFDDFGILVADKTLMILFGKFYKLNNPNLEAHRNMIHLAINELGNLKETNQPIFVYAHLLLPHMPFMFDANGGYLDPVYHQNWDYYIDNYNYSIKVAEEMVTNILSQYPEGEMPIIVLQSDHGARNKATSNPEGKILPEFGEDYKKSILNAMLLPNCPEVIISDNFNPMNTFPVIFECAFGEIVTKND